MSLKRKLMLFLVLAGLCNGAQALERRYLAAMEQARWELTGDSRILCRLEHEIPRFGRAVFTREAGRRLRLELITSLRVSGGTRAELRSETAMWQRPRSREVLASLKTVGKESLFDISGPLAERVFHELAEGNQPEFLFDVNHPMIASLSTVRFRDNEQPFKNCVSRLHDSHFEDVRLSHIHFETDDEFASQHEEENALLRMLQYLQVDESIAEIVVSGHADRTGAACYNDGLSERRAMYVYDLLIARGIDSQRLRLEYHGEHRPLSDGNSSKALAANRRVQVELRRQAF